MNAPISDETNTDRAERAYARLRPELASLPASSVLPIKVSAIKTVQTVLAALPRLRALAGEVSRALPTFDQRLFDKLEECAWAFSATEAHLVAAEAEAMDDARPGLLKQASDLRRLLMSDASALCMRGFLKQSDLGRVKGLNGYDRTAQDLACIVSFLRPLLTDIRGKSAISAADLDLATELIPKLWMAGDVRRCGSPAVDFASDERARAFALLSRVYAEVRRSIGYLRAAEGDVDRLMPRLVAGPRRGQ